MSYCRAGLLLATAIIMSACALGGCAGSSGESSPDALAAIRSPESEPGLYRLRVGDRIRLSFLTDETLQYVAPVSPAGTISLPSGDEVRAAGLTISELTLLVEEKMSSFLVDSTASIVISDLGDQPVYVLGEVRSPGQVPMVNGKISVGMAVAGAGGLLSTGKPSSVMVVRTVGVTEAVAIPVDVTKVLSGRDLSQDIELMPYDIVYVPKSVIGKVGEFVDLFFSQIAPAQLFYLRGYDILERRPITFYQ
jgi:protein involved in polysaccharide export with SLBB domain